MTRAEVVQLLGGDQHDADTALNGLILWGRVRVTHNRDTFAIGCNWKPGKPLGPGSREEPFTKLDPSKIPPPGALPPTMDD
jgi:hypothetical protein